MTRHQTGIGNLCNLGIVRTPVHVRDRSIFRKDRHVELMRFTRKNFQFVHIERNTCDAAHDSDRTGFEDCLRNGNGNHRNSGLDGAYVAILVHSRNLRLVRAPGQGALSCIGREYGCSDSSLFAFFKTEARIADLDGKGRTQHSNHAFRCDCPTGRSSSNRSGTGTDGRHGSV